MQMNVYVYFKLNWNKLDAVVYMVLCYSSFHFEAIF